MYLNDVETYLRDAPFESDTGIVNLRPSKGTHWVVYINEIYSDSNGCAPPKKLSKIIKKRNGHCLNFECKTPGLNGKRDSYCVSYCLYIIYSTNVFEIDYTSAILN